MMTKRTRPIGLPAARICFQLFPALRIAAPTDHGPLPAGKPLSEIVNARRESADRISWCHSLRPPCFRSGLTAPLAMLFHQAQSSSASRFTAGAAGFLNFSQSGDRPER